VNSEAFPHRNNEEFAAVRAEPLQRMRQAEGKSTGLILARRRIKAGPIVKSVVIGKVPSVM